MAISILYLLNHVISTNVPREIPYPKVLTIVQTKSYMPKYPIPYGYKSSSFKSHQFFTLGNTIYNFDINFKVFAI